MQIPCPYLPEADSSMNWRALNQHRKSKGAPFYQTSLTYAQVLWQKNIPARALLAVDRALLTDLDANDPVLIKHPLPYKASAWIVKHYDKGAFVGNPRVHFQHLATRVREPRKNQRKWRAWACWALTKLVRPHLSGDAKQDIKEPDIKEIAAGLIQYGLPGEFKIWQSALEECKSW